ncbi:inhibitor of Bruton tyrosine kinase-like, partial [Anopheles cruzii]|uniref:inhibitor of Bruton tyrosine kinase-like n=1 Tax=Anopheles cruzii TaxID=68878 RepID=UPI0022EC2C32
MEFTSNTDDYECTAKCNHGNAITAALTKRSVPDKQLAAFVAKTCRNFANVIDEYGRSALQMAASVDRDVLVEWLINQGANIAQKDTESGYTALHWALYCGSVASAVRLVKHGAPLDTPNYNFVNPLQLCSSGKRLPVCDTEVVVWGKNKNYNLGIDSLRDRERPGFIDCFLEDNIRIKRVAISAYHSVFLPPDSKEVYVVGYGVGGRLGMEGEYTVTRPQRLPVPASQNTTILDVSAGKYHTLLLRDDNRIFACGENKHCQLGISPPPEKQLTFRDISERSVLYKNTIARVIAKDYHSIAVGIHDVYVWGLNGGQFGLECEAQGEVFVQPKALVLPGKRDATVVLVESSNAAIAVWTFPPCLYILSDFDVKVFKNPLEEQIKQLSVAGGDLQTAREDVTRLTGEVRVIVITVRHLIYIWYEDQQQFVRCVFPKANHLEVENMMWCGDSVLVLLLGHLYRGTLTHQVLRSERSHHSDSMKMFFRRSDVCESLKTRIELQRIPNLTHVRDFVCHEGTENYAALIEHSRRTLEVPEWKPRCTGFESLLAAASPDDAVHDVVLCVEGNQFAAHRFIVYHRWEFLRRLLQASPTCQEFDLMQCGIDGLTVDAFKLAMRYIYTNRYVGREDILRQLRKPGEKPGDPKPGAIAELCNQLRGVFERLELSRLAEMLERIYSPSSGLLAYDPPEEPFPALPFDSYRELYDLTILLQGGETLRVHRCVLVARLEYFAVMFAHNWGENRTTVDLHTIPHSTMKLIVTFLYDHDPYQFEAMADMSLKYLLPTCDQFFVEDLKRLLETLLVDKVNLYNVTCNLEFACQFNCELLKGACLQMISTNLDRLLEGHLLESLAPNLLEQIGTFYRKHYNLDSYQTITPFSDAIDDEDLDQLVHEFDVQLEEKPLDARAEKGHVSRSQQQKLSLEKEAIPNLQPPSLDQ